MINKKPMEEFKIRTAATIEQIYLEDTINEIISRVNMLESLLQFKVESMEATFTGETFDDKLLIEVLDHLD